MVMLGHKYPRMFSPEGGPSDDNGYGFGIAQEMDDGSHKLKDRNFGESLTICPILSLFFGAKSAFSISGHVANISVYKPYYD